MKDNEVVKIVQGVSKSISGIRERAVAGEINSVTIEIKTKDGRTVRHTVLGSEVRKTLGVYQTIGNCVGFPASREADFAAVRSVINKPGPLLRDYLAGKLDWFFKGNSSYRRAVFFEMRNERMVLKLPATWWPKHDDKFYIVGKRKERMELELSICDYLQKEKENKKKKK